MKRSRLCGALMLMALVGAGCSSTDSVSNTTAGPAGNSSPTTAALPAGSDPTESNPSAAGSSTASVPRELGVGVSEDTITIGYTYLDLDDLREAGVIDLNHGPIDEHLATMVAHINATGGINGRTLEVVTTTFDPVSEAAQLSGCIELTEDNEVFAVLGAARADNVLCYTETHDTIAIMQQGMTPERLERSTAPYATVSASTMTSIEAFVADAEQRGLFEGKTVAVHSTDAERDAQNVAVPALRDAGIEVVYESYPALDGTVEGVAASTELKIEAMRARDVDAVFVVGDAILVADSFATDDFFPTLFITEQGSAAAAATRVDLNLFPNLYTFGGFSDVARFEEQTFQDECASVWNAAHPDDQVLNPNDVPTGEPNHVVGLGNVCRTLAIFVAVARAAGENLNQDTFQDALDNLGSFRLPGLGEASLGAGKYDAADDLRLSTFDPSIAESDSGFVELP